LVSLPSARLWFIPLSWFSRFYGSHFLVLHFTVWLPLFLPLLVFTLFGFSFCIFSFWFASLPSPLHRSCRLHFSFVSLLHRSYVLLPLVSGLVHAVTTHVSFVYRSRSVSFVPGFTFYHSTFLVPRSGFSFWILVCLPGSIPTTFSFLSRLVPFVQFLRFYLRFTRWFVCLVWFCISTTFCLTASYCLVWFTGSGLPAPTHHRFARSPPLFLRWMDSGSTHWFSTGSHTTRSVHRFTFLDLPVPVYPLTVLYFLLTFTGSPFPVLDLLRSHGSLPGFAHSFWIFTSFHTRSHSTVLLPFRSFGTSCTFTFSLGSRSRSRSPGSPDFLVPFTVSCTFCSHHHSSICHVYTFVWVSFVVHFPLRFTFVRFVVRYIIFLVHTHWFAFYCVSVRSFYHFPFTFYYYVSTFVHRSSFSHVHILRFPLVVRFVLHVPWISRSVPSTTLFVSLVTFRSFSPFLVPATRSSGFPPPTLFYTTFGRSPLEFVIRFSLRSFISFTFVRSLFHYVASYTLGYTTGSGFSLDPFLRSTFPHSLTTSFHCHGFGSGLRSHHVPVHWVLFVPSCCFTWVALLQFTLHALHTTPPGSVHTVFGLPRSYVFWDLDSAFTWILVFLTWSGSPFSCGLLSFYFVYHSFGFYCCCISFVHSFLDFTFFLPFLHSFRLILERSTVTTFLVPTFHVVLIVCLFTFPTLTVFLLHTTHRFPLRLHRTFVPYHVYVLDSRFGFPTFHAFVCTVWLLRSSRFHLRSRSTVYAPTFVLFGSRSLDVLGFHCGSSCCTTVHTWFSPFGSLPLLFIYYYHLRFLLYRFISLDFTTFVRSLRSHTFRSSPFYHIFGPTSPLGGFRFCTHVFTFRSVLFSFHVGSSRFFLDSFTPLSCLVLDCSRFLVFAHCLRTCHTLDHHFTAVPHTARHHLHRFWFTALHACTLPHPLDTPCHTTLHLRTATCLVLRSTLRSHTTAHHLHLRFTCHWFASLRFCTPVFCATRFLSAHHHVLVLRGSFCTSLVHYAFHSDSPLPHLSAPHFLHAPRCSLHPSLHTGFTLVLFSLFSLSALVCTFLVLFWFFTFVPSFCSFYSISFVLGLTTFPVLFLRFYLVCCVPRCLVCVRFPTFVVVVR